MRKITPEGRVSTVNLGGTRVITGLAINGNYLYYSDNNQHTIRRRTLDSGFDELFAGGTNANPNLNAGLVDGTAGGARFRGPAGLAFDSGGILYVADAGNHAIRQISPNKVVTTIAGDGVPGRTDNGAGTTGVRFNSPKDVAIGADRSIYVADDLNHRIRRIVPSRTAVVTHAGSNSFAVSGFVNARGNVARFNRPHSVAVDADGNVYVADALNHMIRKINPNREVTSLSLNNTSGFIDGTFENARFNNPQGIEVDPSGNLFIGDRDNHAIRHVVFLP